MKVYTKTGDKGKTGLLGGERVDKYHFAIDLYGDFDSINAHIGQFLELVDQSKLVRREKMKFHLNLLNDLQVAFFDFGSLMACDPASWGKFKLQIPKESLVTDMEKGIDSMEQDLEPLSNFILPGGVLPASFAHIVRTETRKLERKVCSHEEKIPEQLKSVLLPTLNRLSDYFFVMSRWLNKYADRREVLWTNKG
jgi:cob(I)alamin adenosyltransferase